MEGAARTKLIPANQPLLHLRGLRIGLPDRAELTGIAIQKASRLYAPLTPSQVFVVGDTPRDIEAAKAEGPSRSGLPAATTRWTSWWMRGAPTCWAHSLRRFPACEPIRRAGSGSRPSGDVATHPDEHPHQLLTRLLRAGPGDSRRRIPWRRGLRGS